MLDALRFTGRVGVELGRIGWMRMVPRVGDVPRTIADVSAPWVADVLSRRFSGARVAGLKVLGGDSGTTERRRLAIEYVSGGRPDGAPSSVFVKVRPPGLTEQLFGKILALGPNEVGFYRDLQPIIPIRVPECYGAFEGKSGEFALLLEDLEAKGARFRTIADPVTLEEARDVVEALARLHSAFWAPPPITDRFPWLQTVSRNPNAAIERFVCHRAHRPTLRRYSALLPESVRRGAARINKERRALERYWGDGPLTLIHGDSHVGNMYFVGGEAGFFDWQVLRYHQGIRDVAYFVILSLDTGFRRAHERDLVELYVRRLREDGVLSTDVDPDQTWERYRSFALYAYLATSVTAAMSDLQPADIAELGLKRAATAVDDLESLRLLDRIG
jgi:hypothetical protein